MDKKDIEIKKAAFILAFIEIIREVLDIELPSSATEREMIEKAYDICYKKILHIKTSGR